MSRAAGNQAAQGRREGRCREYRRDRGRRDAPVPSRSSRNVGTSMRVVAFVRAGTWNQSSSGQVPLGGRAAGGDQLVHAGPVARAQERDRVGIAVDDALEERPPVLVGGQRGLGPSAGVVEDRGQLGVLAAVELSDLAL